MSGKKSMNTDPVAEVVGSLVNAFGFSVIDELRVAEDVATRHRRRVNQRRRVLSLERKVDFYQISYDEAAALIAKEDRCVVERDAELREIKEAQKQSVLDAGKQSVWEKEYSKCVEEREKAGVEEPSVEGCWGRPMLSL